MRAIVASEVPSYRDTLRQFALNVGGQCGAEDCVEPAEIAARLAMSPADVVVWMLANEPEPDLIAIQRVSSMAPVLVIGSGQDPAQILRILRAGAREFLDQNNLRDELAAAFERLSNAAGVAHMRRGRTLAVTAPNAGSGVTTVASGLAFALAYRYPEQVALVELGQGVPELAIDLDFDPKIAIDQMLRDWERLDAAMVQQTSYQHKAGVHVLAHKPETLEVEPAHPEAIRHVLRLLRTQYEFSILDLGNSAHPGALESMKIADMVVVVVRLDVPSLRLGRQYVRHLADKGIPAEKFRLVVNRYGQSRQVNWRKVEEFIGLPPLVWIPEDQSTLNDAVNRGLPLVQASRRARITRRFDELAFQLNGTPQKK